jgi:hypothetical protein
MSELDEKHAASVKMDIEAAKAFMKKTADVLRGKKPEQKPPEKPEPTK